MDGHILNCPIIVSADNLDYLMLVSKVATKVLAGMVQLYKSAYRILKNPQQWKQVQISNSLRVAIPAL